jgi:hypothetical protein
MSVPRLIIYYECIDQPLDASYDPFAAWKLTGTVPIEKLSLDSQSDPRQLQLAQRAMTEAHHILLIIDSRKSENIAGVTALINKLKHANGKLIWYGEHEFAKKALAMTHGIKADEQAIQEKIDRWINQS